MARKARSTCGDFRATSASASSTSVTRGKNQMPPWGGLSKPEEIEALWAYVVTGE